MDANFPAGRPHGDLWPWYLSGLENVLNSPNRLEDWDVDATPWLLIKNDTLINLIVEIAERVKIALDSVADAVI